MWGYIVAGIIGYLLGKEPESGSGTCFERGGRLSAEFMDRLYRATKIEGNTFLSPLSLPT